MAEVVELLFSIKNKIFTSKTLETYKSVDFFEKIEKEIFLFKRLEKTDLETFKNKIAKDGYFSMKTFKNYETRKTYHKMNPTYNVCYKPNIGTFAFKYEDKYYFFDQLVMKDFYKIGNQFFSNIEFVQRPIPLQVKIVPNLIEDFPFSDSFLFLTPKYFNNCKIHIISDFKPKEIPTSTLFNLVSIEAFNKNILKYYTHYLKHGAKIVNVTQEEIEKILKLDPDSFEDYPDFLSQANLAKLNHKVFYERVKNIVKDLDFKLFKYEKKDNLLKRWANENYIRCLDCCSPFIEHLTQNWQIVGNPLKKDVLVPYKKYFYDAMQRTRETALSIPLNTTIFRGLSIKKDLKIETKEKAFVSFSYNFEYSTNFSELRDDDYKSYMLYYDVKKEIKCPVFQTRKTCV